MQPAGSHSKPGKAISQKPHQCLHQPPASRTDESLCFKPPVAGAVFENSVSSVSPPLPPPRPSQAPAGRTSGRSPDLGLFRAPPPLLTSLVLSLSVPTVVMGGRRERQEIRAQRPSEQCSCLFFLAQG